MEKLSTVITIISGCFAIIGALYAFFQWTGGKQPNSRGREGAVRERGDASKQSKLITGNDIALVVGALLFIWGGIAGLVGAGMGFAVATGLWPVDGDLSPLIKMVVGGGICAFVGGIIVTVATFRA